MEGEGVAAPLLVDSETGALIVTGGGGGGSTDMSVTNALLTTTAADTAIIKDEAILIDAKLPALSSGRIPVEANNAASQDYNWTVTGAVAANSTLFGPIDCSEFREFSIQVVSLGTGLNVFVQISNNGTTYVAAPVLRNDGTIANNGSIGQLNIFSVNVLGARFLRIFTSTAQTTGTTTLVAYASQQATPKLYQSVTATISGSPAFIPTANINTGFGLFHSLVSAATTNATVVKSNQGALGSCLLTNTSASFKYVKFYNSPTAPSVGTSTPVIQFPIPPNSTLDVSTSCAGMRFSTGISYAITGGSALLDSTAVDAAEVLVNLVYV
jgi:hypothetical protein